MDVLVGVHAIRSFNFAVIPNGLTALPVVFNGVLDAWRGGVCTAQCYKHDASWPSRPYYGLPVRVQHESVPAQGCECGIYGMFSLASLSESLGLEPPGVPRFVAVIAAEGETIIGEHGLRTAYARVVAHWGEAVVRWGRGAGFIIPCSQLRDLFPGAQHYSDLGEMLGVYEIGAW